METALSVNPVFLDVYSVRMKVYAIVVNLVTFCRMTLALHVLSLMVVLSALTRRHALLVSSDII